METKKRKLVVLAHFMDRDSVCRAIPFAKFIPYSLLEKLLWHLPARFSFMVVSHFDIIDRAEGYIIGIALTPKQMKSEKKEVVRKKILAATLYAQKKLGCEFLMLGALTAPATSAGLYLTENPKVKLNITTGNAYTSSITLDSVYKAVELAGLNLADLTVAVIGASGTIGEAVSRVLSEQVQYLILVGRDENKLSGLADKIKTNNFKTTIDINDISEADVVVTATSHPDALIDPKILKQKAIVIDVAEPSDMPKNIGEIRPDIINIDGGRVRWPDIDVKFNLGVPKNIGFACMTEGLMQTLENDKNNHVGSIDLDYLKRTKQWGEKYGWTLPDFTSFNKEIPSKKFEQ